MTDRDGNDVSIDNFWRSTMMANAARDPYWIASVRFETLLIPEISDDIEAKCATCHMPMAAVDLTLQNETPLILDDGLLVPDTPLHALAMDGVSCTVCHQIEETGLGTPDSFTGHFTVDPDLPMGERLSYTRFEVNQPDAQMMAGASGFVPAVGLHTQQAELCATCHTLYTPYFNADHELLGEFPEQTPYLEWQNSALADTVDCQYCHMPKAAGAVVTSTTGGTPRSPFSEHVYVGGNTYMMQIFQNFGPDMNVTASNDHFADTELRTTEHLQQHAALLNIENTALQNEMLAIDLAIKVFTGHKLPTGFPSRRAWLHVTVTDANGHVIFESGEYQPDGRILDDDHDTNPTQFEPHYETITQDDQVQIYESVAQDAEGTVTNKLLFAAGYIKDNRLLPFGFDRDHATDATSVRGVATEDSDFVGGGDRIRYQVAISDSEGPYTVKAELLYLSIGFNWIEKLRITPSPEGGSILRVCRLNTKHARHIGKRANHFRAVNLAQPRRLDQNEGVPLNNLDALAVSVTSTGKQLQDSANVKLTGQ